VAPVSRDASVNTALPLGLFVGSYLRVSETFIHDQLSFQQRFRATVCARERHPDSALFPYTDVHALGPLERARSWATGAAPSFTALLRRREVRLIHAHYGLNGVRALPFARELGCPLVVTFHGHDVGGLFPRNRFSARYFRYQRGAARMFAQAALLLCASGELAELLVERFGAPADKVRVHRLGIDLTRFAHQPRPERAPTILMVGRLVEKKGMVYGLRAFAAALPALPEARLRIIGDGPLRAGLESEIRELGLSQSVELLGALPSERVRSAMLEADVLIAPSVESASGDRESGVIVLKEAAATGLATIGSRHGGIPEIIEHERTGYLTPERDAAAISQALLQLMQSHALRERMGRLAREKMEREYDTRAQNAALEGHLLSVL